MTASSNTGFALDKRNGKMMGVCAGLANWMGWNPMLVRLGVIAATIFVFGPVALLAYFLIGWAAS